MVEVMAVAEAVVEATVAEVLPATAFVSQGCVCGDQNHGGGNQGCGKVSFAAGGGPRP